VAGKKCDIAKLITALAFVLVSVACNAAPTTRPSSASSQDKPEYVTITLGAPVDAPIKRLLGVNIGPAPAGSSTNPNLVTRYRELNINLVRTHDFYGPLDMAVMYPDRTRDPSKSESYDFTASDAMWRYIVGAGCEPYLRLGDSWNNAAPPANAAERANWAQAAIAVVRHYRDQSWWGVKYASQLRYVEIWNEPDNQQFWQKPRTPLEYFQLYEETARALKQAFPDLIVGAPGLTPAGALAPQGKKWTQGFLDYVKQKDAPLDFLSWHMYSNDPNDWVNASRFYRGELDARGFAKTTQHITEWNTDVKNKNVSDADALALRTGGKGAAILTAAWIAMQQTGVEVATFYRGPDPAMDAPTFYGLFYANGAPKKSALAFLLWSKMADHPKRLSVTTAPNTALWMLAGTSDSGEIALLIANPTDAASKYAIVGAANRQPTILQTNDADYAGRAFPPTMHLIEQIPSLKPTGNIVEIGAYTTQLVLFKE
jgi:hypothetical protein